MKTPYPAILFDLDGTLLDTAPDLALTLNTLLTIENRLPLPFAVIRQAISQGVAGMIKLGFHIDHTAPQFSTLRESFLKIYKENLVRESQPFAGIDKVLAHLNKKQIPWGVVTNKESYFSNALLTHWDLFNAARCLVSGNTLAYSKPHPQPLLYAAQLLGCDANECIYIGDAHTDIIAAKRAGMTSIAALYGYIAFQDTPLQWEADHYINRPTEIIDVISYVTGHPVAENSHLRPIVDEK